jgi:hypothetical protein
MAEKYQIALCNVNIFPTFEHYRHHAHHLGLFLHIFMSKTIG